MENGSRSCNISPVLHGNTNSLFLLRMSTSFDLKLFHVNFRWWHCFEILSIHFQKITSPTSLPRVHLVHHEFSTKDFGAELMHSTLVHWWYWIEFLLLSSKWKNRQFKGWIEKAFIRCLAICEKVLHTSKTALTLHGFCPPAFQKSRLNPHWRSALFHSSYSSFRNSMCFGSTWSRSLMIQIQLFASIHRLQRICPHKWILGFLVGVRMFGVFSASLELMWLCMGNFESIAWPNHLWPLQICGAVQISGSSRSTLWSAVIITPKSFGNLHSVRPIVRICLAWHPRNLRASAQLRNAMYLWKWVNKLCFPPAFLK